MENIDGHDFSPEDACNIRAKRFGKLLLSKAISDNIIVKSNCVLEVDISHIIRVLEKKYHTYYEGIVQNSLSGDIVEMTNKKQTEWEKEFPSSTDEMINNVRWWMINNCYTIILKSDSNNWSMSQPL